VLLYDANGCEVYEGGLTHDDIRDAIQAAALASDFKLAYEIVVRYGWRNICLNCASVPAEELCQEIGGWPVCTPCKEKLAPVDDFSDVRFYAQGLIRRDVQ
jgi:hypothetical protein